MIAAARPTHKLAFSRCQSPALRQRTARTSTGQHPAFAGSGQAAQGSRSTAANAAATAPPVPELAPPPLAFQAAVNAGAGKAQLSATKIFVLGLLAGAYIGLGALLMLTCGGNCPGLAASNPGLKAVISGLIGLPCGLLMVIIAGGELYTGNTALVTAAVLEGRASVPQLAKSWLWSYVGNLVASVALAWVAVQAGMFATNPAAAGAALAKTSVSFWPAFAKGALCNWLVCLAIWMATATTTLPGKALAVMFPIPAFVALGLEHSVANMFIIPAGIFAAGKVTWSAFFLNNLLPVTLGNTFAGAVLVAGMYSAAFGSLGKSE